MSFSRKIDKAPQLSEDGDISTVMLKSLAGAMRFRGSGYIEIEAALLAANKIRCKPPKSNTEVKAIARWGAEQRPLPDDSASDAELDQQEAMLKSLAGEMRFHGSSYVEIEAALLAANKARCNPLKSAVEVNAIARWAAKQPITSSTPFGEGGDIGTNIDKAADMSLPREHPRVSEPPPPSS